MEEEIKGLEEEDVIEAVQDPLQSLRKKTRELEEKEQSLKSVLLRQEQANKLLYDELYEARRKLFALQLAEFNKEQTTFDLGLYLEFQELHREIEVQQRKIESLNAEIRREGLTAASNNKEYIDLKQKLSEIEKEIVFGRKFISTQYFRHYLQLPQAYKISYEDVRLDYERKLKIKESLEGEKHKYEQRKRQLIKLLQDRRNDYHELQRQLSKLG